MSVKLPYGLRDNVLVHISAAARGLACGCVCSACGDKLVARKGDDRCHHFAHQSGKECATAVETALHRAAKEILLDCRKMMLPCVQVTLNMNCYPLELYRERMVSFDEVHEETRVDAVIPDIVGYRRGTKLLIEIHVSHAVPPAKLTKIRELNISAIEVDLSSACRTFDADELRKVIVRMPDHKTWLHNVKASEFTRLGLKMGELRSAVSFTFGIYVPSCTLTGREVRGVPVANIETDCRKCDFGLGVARDFSWVICGHKANAKRPK